MNIFSLIVKKRFIYVLLTFVNLQIVFCDVREQDTALPSFLKVCKQSDPNLKRCVKESVEGLRSYLVKGIPEWDMPSIEPLVIPEVLIDQGNGPVAVKSTYRDVKVYGPSSFVIRNVKVDLKKNKVKAKLYFPMLKVNTNYTMEGRILMMPISGSGLSFGNYNDFHAQFATLSLVKPIAYLFYRYSVNYTNIQSNFGNVESTITIKVENVERNGEKYYNVKDFDVDFDIGDASIRFDNLFNGDTELGEHMNLFLNDNWKTVAEEIKPVLEDTISKVFKKLSNNIFYKYPVKMLFPE